MQPEQLWTYFENVGYNTRKGGEDGLRVWKEIRGTLSDAPIGGQISPTILGIILRAYNVKEDDTEHEEVQFCDPDGELGEILSNTKEVEHFFIQHFRIPVMAKYELTRRKFAQIAYNAGQFRAEQEKSTYGKAVEEYYIKNNLGKWDSYF